MNLESALNDLYAQLERAEAEVMAASEDYHSCTLNTPGRCSREADRLERARQRVRNIRAQLARVEVDA